MVVAMRLFSGFLRLWLIAIVGVGNYVSVPVVMMSKVLRNFTCLVMCAIDAHCCPSRLEGQERY